MGKMGKQERQRKLDECEATLRQLTERQNLACAEYNKLPKEITAVLEEQRKYITLVSCPICGREQLEEYMQPMIDRFEAKRAKDGAA